MQQVEIEFDIGETVIDDLTGSEAIITEMHVDKKGNVGYKLNVPYLDGWRHSWEITPIK